MSQFAHHQPAYGSGFVAMVYGPPHPGISVAARLAYLSVVGAKKVVSQTRPTHLVFGEIWNTPVWWQLITDYTHWAHLNELDFDLEARKQHLALEALQYGFGEGKLCLRQIVKYPSGQMKAKVFNTTDVVVTGMPDEGVFEFGDGYLLPKMLWFSALEVAEDITGMMAVT